MEGSKFFFPQENLSEKCKEFLQFNAYQSINLVYKEIKLDIKHDNHDFFFYKNY